MPICCSQKLPKIENSLYWVKKAIMQSANFDKMAFGIIYFTLNPLSILQDFSRVQKTVTTLFCTYNKISSILAFRAVKSLKVISSFNLKRMKKIVRWHCGTKISKTNLKAIISPLLSCPQGCQGCQKNLGPNWRQLWWVEAIRFSPNWIKFKKLSEKRVSLKLFVQFWQFFTVSSIWLNLSTPTHQSIFNSVCLFGFFYTPGTPGGKSIVEWNKFWSFISMWYLLVVGNSLLLQLQNLHQSIHLW